MFQLNNDSKYNKSIGFKKLEYRMTNFKSIDFNNIILDYGIKSSKEIVGGTNGKIDQFLLYAINNSYNYSIEEVIIEYYADDKLINFNFDTKINLNMNPGEIREILKVDFLERDLVEMFRENSWTKLQIIIIFKCEKHEFSFRFIDGAFQFRMGQIGAGGPPTKTNVQNLLISKNGSDYNTGIIKFPSNSQEQFTLKIFSPRSSRFIFTDEVQIYVPVYYVRQLTRNILYFNQFSKFMSDNNLEIFNLEDRIYDTSKLEFYDYYANFLKRDM